MVKVVHRGYVVVVGLKLHVGVDGAQRGGGSNYLALAWLVWLEEEPVHVGQLHLVVVEEKQLSGEGNIRGCSTIYFVKENGRWLSIWVYV